MVSPSDQCPVSFHYLQVKYNTILRVSHFTRKEHSTTEKLYISTQLYFFKNVLVLKLVMCASSSDQRPVSFHYLQVEYNTILRVSHFTRKEHSTTEKFLISTQIYFFKNVLVLKLVMCASSSDQRPVSFHYLQVEYNTILRARSFGNILE